MVKQVKITVIVDNKSIVGDEYAPGGFSALVENELDDGTIIKILFDTGPENERLKINLQKLKLDISDIDYIVLSHGHFDHTGGLSYAFTNSNDYVRVVCHPDTLIEKILILEDGTEKNVGIQDTKEIERIEQSGRIIKRKDEYRITDNIWITGEIPRKNDYEILNPMLKKVIKRENGIEEQDQLDDDISLVIELEDNSKIVICGCCHSGIVNTINHIIKKSDNNISFIIGGLQLHQANERLLVYTKKKFQEIPLRCLYPMHSTGDVGIEYFKENLGNIYKEGGVGTTIIIKSNI